MSLDYIKSKIQNASSEMEIAYFKYKLKCDASSTQFAKTKLAFAVKYFMVNS